MALSKVSLVAADTVSELTSGSGVTVDGSLLKDTEITTGKVIGNGDTDSFLEFAGSNVVNVSAGGGDTALRIDANKDILMFGPGDLHAYDDHGIVFGDGNDWMIAGAAGESTLEIFKGGTNTVGTNEGQLQFAVGDSAESYINIVAGEGNTTATLYLGADQVDDNNDRNRIFANNDGIYFGNYADGAWDEEFRIGDDLVYAEHTISVQGVDYAEFFEWKTELTNDAKIKETYGLTVVLDGNKVKLAEAGEESKVIGVVRPSKVAGTVGGDGIYWKDKYKKDSWGEYEKEAYTQVNWHILHENGESLKHYSFMKDRIPKYELIDQPKQDVKDWHLLESNFKKDDKGNKITLSVPSTDAEKTATKYTERTTHKQTGETLMRKIFSDSFDQSKTYVSRDDRRKEWAIVGLLGQVPVRDSAIIPTHWTKMKNLESGIDLYYIK